jgi:hypothetical protein
MAKNTGREVGFFVVPNVFPMCSHSVLIKISMSSQHVHQVPSSSLLYPSSFALSSPLFDLAQKVEEFNISILGCPKLECFFGVMGSSQKKNVELWVPTIN